MVLSHDTMCYIDWYPEEMRAALPDYNYLHIPDDVVPALRAAGVIGRPDPHDDDRQPAPHLRGAGRLLSDAYANAPRGLPHQPLRPPRLRGGRAS